MIVELPSGLTARPTTIEDLEAVTEVFAASELAADGAVDITAEDLRSDWGRPSFDLANDSVVVLDGGRVVAYAEVFAGRAWARVHPDARGRGIGVALVRWTEGRAGQLGADKLGQTVSDRDEAAVELLRSLGYAVRWETWLFQIALDEEPPPPELPEGMTLRAMQLGVDDRPVHELIERAFSDWPDRDAGYAFEDWAASYLQRAGFDPSLTMLLHEGDTLVGVSLNQVYEDEGYVEQIAVERTHRGRGLGRALLQASFGEFHRRGLRKAGLSTESRTGARGLYEHVGMRIIRSFKRYSKDL